MAELASTTAFCAHVPLPLKMANSAMALQCTGKYKTYDECYQLAVESLESGKAYDSLLQLTDKT